MHTPVPTLVAVLILSGSVIPASAQSVRPQPAPVPVFVRASTAGGNIHGVVRDEAGQLVGGVSVIAMGTTMAAAESDRLGHFLLALPPGEYILRASRDGYLSTFREPVRISPSALLERNITLVRLWGVPLASETAAVIDQTAGGAAPGDHSHEDLAWRLRHLRRAVLRDEGPARSGDPASGDPAELDATAEVPGLFDRALQGLARRATAFFRDTDFTGQVNWMTTGAVDLRSGHRETSLTGSMAYLAVGAPVGTHGSWLVRGALSPGEPSSWVLLGEYEADPDERHAFRAGVSYGALRPGRDDAAAATLSIADARTAGAVFGFDRWRVGPGLEVSYGLRVDAYDYLAGTPLVSPHVGARIALPHRTSIVVNGFQLAVAPGAAEFRPPDTPGLWMPPDRTFSPLRQGSPLRAERVGHVDVGIEHTFGQPETARTVSVRRFRQSTDGQFASLFGLGQSGSAHYFTAAVGDVDLDAWSVGVRGRLVPHVRGLVDYAAGRVSWRRPEPIGPVKEFAPSVVRSEGEHLRDLAADLQAEIPRTATRVSMAYRLSSGFSQPGESGGPSFGGRFKIEVRQELPVQPIRGGTIDVLVGIRNLYLDLDGSASLYDELLTVSPPVWFVGGIQVRF